MKRIYTILLSLVFIFLFSLNTFAQKGDVEDILIVLPAQSIAKFVTRLLPYEINMGKNFSGSLSLQRYLMFFDKISHTLLSMR